jgi:outer membrane immunogenic protein
MDGDEIMNFKLLGTGIAVLSLLATSFSARAADVPRPVYKAVRSVVAYYNWSGFYAGINAGYGFGDSKWDFSTTALNPSGAMVGGTFGYNYQTGALVWGFEADFDWAFGKGSETCGTFSCETKSSWLGTARGRLGYAIDRWMPYLTGGGAYGHVKALSTDPTSLAASKNMLGWTGGGGLEYAFAGNWTAKIEYLYLDLGSFNCLTCAPAASSSNVTFSEHAIRAGLNYKFSGPIFRRW